MNDEKAHNLIAIPIEGDEDGLILFCTECLHSIYISPRDLPVECSGRDIRCYGGHNWKTKTH